VVQAVHFPGSAVGKRFCEFFSHRYSFIEASAFTGDHPDWRTVSGYPIEHRNLWNRFLDPETLVGLSFGPSTHYAVLDIDRGSPYHPYNDEAAFKALLGAYEDIGFNDSMVLQSSFSEGIHVYLVLPNALPTYRLAVTLKLTAIRSGFTVKDGTLEVFPNAKPYNKERPTPYKAVRLPLQMGSYLLDKDYQPFSASIETFLDLAQRAAGAQDSALIETAIEAAHKAKAFRFLKGDGGRASIFSRDLTEQIQEGWTDFGQTNDLLRVIGTYGRVFEGLEGKTLADYIATTALGLPGYHEFCRHQHHIERRAIEWARCIEKFYYPYASEALRVGTFVEMVESVPKENAVNNERQLSAVERIKRGVEFVKEKLIEIPQRVGEMKEALVNAIVELFGVRPSDKTLYRYRDLWHPQVIGEVEVVIVPEAPPEEVESPDIVPPDGLPEGHCEPCHTPLPVVQQNGRHAIALQPTPQAALEILCHTPLYMKVLDWVSGQARLMYRGVAVYSTVSLEGEKNPKIQSISENQEVIIVDHTHSSFLLYPDQEENLQVYVKPIDDAAQWLTGIPVLVKYLFACFE
jgi:hypothetical protein